MKIEGKIAVVIGGARGMGKAYCEAILKKGGKVVIGDILQDDGKKAVSDFCAKFGASTAVFVICDNRKAEDLKGVFQKAMENYGQIDICVHHAGILHEMEWEKCIDINVSGTVRTTNEAMKYMSREHGGKGGVIINTASISALRPEDWGPVYSATRYAVLGYTLSWGLPENFSRTGVRFNCLCPTTVNTEFVKQLVPGRARNAQSKLEIISSMEKLEPSTVAEGLIKLIEDDTVCGKAMRITSKYGHDFAQFQEQPLQ